MTKIAIVSDIHANLAAWTAVFEDAQAEKVNDFWFLGDLFGYGPNPMEVLESLMAKYPSPPSGFLSGNHDEAVVNNMSLIGFDTCAATAIRYHRQIWENEAKEEQKEWVKQLKPLAYLPEEQLIMAHGAYYLKDDGKPDTGAAITTYVSSHNEVSEQFERIPPKERPQIILNGHTHRAILSRWSETGATLTQGDLYRAEGFELTDLNKHPICLNPGSVGCPRGNRAPSYAIFQRLGKYDAHIRFKWVNYPAEDTIQEIDFYKYKIEGFRANDPCMDALKQQVAVANLP